MALPKIKINIKNILFLALILRLFLMFLSASHPDIGNHVDWGERLFEYTPRHFYTGEIWSVSRPNQPFASIYLFAAIAKLRLWIMTLAWDLNLKFPLFPSKLIPLLSTNLHHWLLKLPFIFSDLAIAFLIYKIGQKYFPKKSLLAAALFLFNPAVIYNSTVWGQTDSLINLLALLGIFLITQKKFFSGIFIFLTSFIFKISLIIYLPIFALLLLYYFPKSSRLILLSSLLFLVSFILLSLPFSGLNFLPWFKQTFIDTVLLSQGHMLNGNAFNLWFLVNGADLTTSELQTWSIFTYRQISQIIFFLFQIPLWWHYFKSKKTLNNTFKALFLAAFSAFLILTNMHERYLYPTLPLMVSLIFLDKNKFITLREYLLISLLHLLNLFNLWWYPSLPFLKNFLMWDNFLVGKIIAIFFSYFFLKKYWHYLHEKN